MPGGLSPFSTCSKSSSTRCWPSRRTTAMSWCPSQNIVASSPSASCTPPKPHRRMGWEGARGRKGLSTSGKMSGKRCVWDTIGTWGLSGAETPRGGLTNCGGSKGVYEGVCVRAHVSHVGTCAARPNYIFMSKSDRKHNGLHYNFLYLRAEDSSFGSSFLHSSEN